MKTHSRRRILQALLATPALASAAGAIAQPAWPTRPIRLLVGYPPGGLTDVMARGIGRRLGDMLGQPVLIDNRPGASSNIAAAETVKAGGDGYTLLLAPTSMQTANPWLYKAGFNAASDLVPIAGLAKSLLYLLVRPDLDVRNARDLVEMARRSPGRLSYASAGNATPTHLAGELLKQNAKISATHVPYRGSAPALQDVVAGQCDFLFDPGSALPFVRAGKLKLIGVGSNKRSTFAPEVPTLAEQGIAGDFFDIWFGLWGPSGLSAAIASRLSRELARILLDPELKASFAGFGAEPEYLDQDRFKALLAAEGELFANLIRDRKITAE